MLKQIFKNAVWMALPLGLALGCAANRPATETAAAYGPNPTVLTPTSGEPEQRIYSTVDPATASSSSSMQAPPASANSQNWQVASAIQEKLLQDTSLAPQGSSLVAEVGNDGQVTLKGNVSSPSEKERVHDTIAGVPGVNSVNDDQVGIGRSMGNGSLDMNQPPQ